MHPVPAPFEEVQPPTSDGATRNGLWRPEIWLMYVELVNLLDSVGFQGWNERFQPYALRRTGHFLHMGHVRDRSLAKHRISWGETF